MQKEKLDKLVRTCLSVQRKGGQEQGGLEQCHLQCSFFLERIYILHSPIAVLQIWDFFLFCAFSRASSLKTFRNETVGKRQTMVKFRRFLTTD